MKNKAARQKRVEQQASNPKPLKLDTPVPKSPKDFGYWKTQYHFIKGRDFKFAAAEGEILDDQTYVPSKSFVNSQPAKGYDIIDPQTEQTLPGFYSHRILDGFDAFVDHCEHSGPFHPSKKSDPEIKELADLALKATVIDIFAKDRLDPSRSKFAPEKTVTYNQYVEAAEEYAKEKDAAGNWGDTTTIIVDDSDAYQPDAATAGTEQSDGVDVNMGDERDFESSLFMNNCSSFLLAMIDHVYTSNNSGIVELRELPDEGDFDPSPPSDDDDVPFNFDACFQAYQALPEFGQQYIRQEIGRDTFTSDDADLLGDALVAWEGVADLLKARLLEDKEQQAEAKKEDQPLADIDLENPDWIFKLPDEVQSQILKMIERQEYNIWRAAKNVKLLGDEDLTHANRSNKGYSVKMFNPRTKQPIMADFVEEHIFFVSDDHMPHVRLETTDGQEVDRLNKKYEAERLKKWNMTPEDLKKKKLTFRQRYEMAEDRAEAYSKSTKCDVRFNHQSLNHHAAYVVTPEKRQMLPPKIKKLLKKAPAVQAEITRILAKDDGSVPIVYEANVRLPYAASRQVFMGAPEYARAWQPALKTDRVLAVIEGNANTVEQVKFIGTVLSINKIRDPLKKWQRDGPKRMVFTKKFLLSFPNSPYTIKRFKYGFKFARHSFEESALLTTMASIHDMEWQQDGMKAFEKESLDMKMMPIAGTKGGKLYGFALRPEDDDYPLSDGMNFKMFFKRDKVAEERAEKKTKKAAKKAKKAVTEANKAVTEANKASKVSEKVDEAEDAAQPAKGTPETEPAPPDAFDFDFSDVSDSESDSSSGSESDSSSSDNGGDDKGADGSEKENGPTTPDGTQDLPHFNTVEGAAAHFTARFPNGCNLLETSGRDRACGLYAVCGSFSGQMKGPAPTREDLEAVQQTKEYRDLMKTLELEHVTQDYYPEQLCALASIWSKKHGDHGKPIRLGLIIGELGGERTYHRIFTVDAEACDTLWIQLDSDDVQTLDYHHYSSIEPIEAEEPFDNDPEETDEEHEDPDYDDEYWHVKSIPPLPYVPDTYMCFLITRKWYPDHGETGEFDNRKLNLFDPSASAETEIGQLLDSNQGNQVKLKYMPEAHSAKRLQKAMEELQSPPKDKPLTAFSEKAKILISANNLDSLETRDIFQEVADEGDPEQKMKLNHVQKKIMPLTRNAPGGVVLIQGCPGAGKTHMIVQATKPFFQSSRNHVLQVVSPTNANANDLTLHLAESLQQFGSPKKYVIRLYPTNAEEMIRNRTFYDDMRKANRRPDVEAIEEEDVAALDIVARRVFDQSRATKYKGVTDPRVENLQYSLGQFFLWYIGVEHHEHYTHPNAESLFADIRHRFRRYWTDENMTGEEKSAYKEEERELLNHILRNAAAVISTTYTSSSSFVANALQDETVGIILDEAASERDDNWYPVLATRYSKDPFILMVGDPLQLPPHVFTPLDVSCYKGELECSMFTRLIKVGFPSLEIHRQSRMVPSIRAFVSSLFYGERLTSTPRAFMQSRPFARKFIKWAKGYFGRKEMENVIVLDHREGQFNHTEVSSTGSKSNRFYTLTASRMVQELLKIKSDKPDAADPTIAIIPAYAAQRDQCLAVKASMELANLDGTKDRLFVRTIDAVLGQEFDYVICILPIGHKMGPGFLDDMRRMNVGLSRARDGLLIITSLSELEDIRLTVRHLQQFVQLARTLSIPISTGGVPNKKRDKKETEPAPVDPYVTIGALPRSTWTPDDRNVEDDLAVDKTDTNWAKKKALSEQYRRKYGGLALRESFLKDLDALDARAVASEAGIDNDGWGTADPDAGGKASGGGWNPDAGGEASGGGGWNPDAGGEASGGGGWNPDAGGEASGGGGWNPDAGGEASGGDGWNPDAGGEASGGGAWGPDANADLDAQGTGSAW